MRILCCVKRVPAPGAKINVADDALAVDATHLGFATSPHEECGVEEAVQLVERHGGEVTVLTLGPPEAAEQLRYAASVGAHHGVLVTTDGSAWDPQRTAAALVGAIRGLEAADGPFDVLVFGNESADSGGFQVGIRVAYALGRPIVNGIKGIEADLEAGDGGWCGPAGRSTAVSRCTSCPCRPRSGSKRASTCLDTPRCGGGWRRRNWRSPSWCPTPSPVGSRWCGFTALARRSPRRRFWATVPRRLPLWWTCWKSWVWPEMACLAPATGTWAKEELGAV